MWESSEDCSRGSMKEFNNERLQNILIHYTSNWHSEIVEPVRHLPAGEVHHSGKLSYLNFDSNWMNKIKPDCTAVRKVVDVIRS